MRVSLDLFVLFPLRRKSFEIWRAIPGASLRERVRHILLRLDWLTAQALSAGAGQRTVRSERGGARTWRAMPGSNRTAALRQHPEGRWGKVTKYTDSNTVREATRVAPLLEHFHFTQE